MSVSRIEPYLEPVRKTVRVSRAPEDAFRVFTAGIASWWPLKTHSLSHDRANTCVLEPREGGTLHEIRDDGERIAWAEVLAWDPPRRLVLAWHPGRPEAEAQEVEVRFVADGDGTRVELEHRGWQALGAEAAALRERYDGGWEGVLVERFGGAAGRA